MAEVSGEGAAPDTEVVDIEDGEVARQGDHDGFAGVLLERLLRPVLVRHHRSLVVWSRAFANPEVGVCWDEGIMRTIRLVVSGKVRVEKREKRL